MEQMGIDIFLADIIEARDKKKNVWAKWYERLSGFCDRRFGPNWKDEDPEFWNSLIKYYCICNDSATKSPRFASLDCAGIHFHTILSLPALSPPFQPRIYPHTIMGLIVV
jgi:hypothetical protein